ncbi:hypothetical protein MPTK1_8g15960 [Marchantia polymorpha subsp. ruderalis]|uniref:Uncharacterized protein n=1 Tax=Marchantia polymorpha TaxID=3197 RepID=A0A2R6WKX1_MARPO|nr:hypothetical protein MARPO_0079s0018 [Marchantia polymorpha]BBN20046.1 hypothetical protein Mp_8g15960 [Marchantia polymorpha subsp. ruderalis]|eukprot:PTQ34508.1 hypothetical protein MARPO_0079s0018 [Marchantia polymorpha]
MKRAVRSDRLTSLLPLVLVVKRTGCRLIDSRSAGLDCSSMQRRWRRHQPHRPHAQTMRICRKDLSSILDLTPNSAALLK